METAGDLDEATMEGLRAVFDRFALRDAILASSSSDPQVAWKKLTIEHESVVRRVAQLEREFSIFHTGEGPQLE